MPGFLSRWTDTKLIATYFVGKRSSENTQTFIRDLYKRTAKRLQLTTDAFIFYRTAIEESFGADIDYAQLTKLLERAFSGQKPFSGGRWCCDDPQ